MSLTKRFQVKMKIDLMLENWILSANLSYLMTFGEIELLKSVIHIQYGHLSEN
jgi:hypothetical protein